MRKKDKILRGMERLENEIRAFYPSTVIERKMWAYEDFDAMLYVFLPEETNEEARSAVSEVFFELLTEENIGILVFWRDEPHTWGDKAELMKAQLAAS